ncbi:glycosyltransferase family A protein [Flavobacterium sp. ACAM 123]|uniref:glycosyltransferase family A protein n=1 Tax=Flavobacterium sp. ACAM 123 TaxID=1189620 RepID=UPI00030FDCE9|nr:glycosyltransferase family 2 protein [Flavobacterium sp. ACAM 123]
MLAIIIPYYKRNFFEETLKSLDAQKDKRFTVYIGDDGSLEDPTDLLEMYRGKFDFVYKRFEDNLGGTALVRQWGRCIALSESEEWLLILGDDDSLGENVVEEFYRNLPEIESNRINLVKFATQSVNKMTNSVSEIFVNQKFEKATDFYYRRYLGLARSSLSEHIFRRESYLKYNFKNYPLAWHSDDYAWINFAENKPILSINEALVLISVSNESISGMTTNVFKKNIAESNFFMDLIKHKLNLFNHKQRLKLLLQAEVSIRKTRKLYLSEWRVLFVMYLYNFFIFHLLKLIRRFLKSIIK